MVTRRLPVLPLLCACAGCANGGASPDDPDGDGLNNTDESGYGTDPDVADTDGDGFDDGAEVGSNTDPLDADDMPYLAGWPIDPCRGDVDGAGEDVGMVSRDFSLPDQFGETVHLSDFCDQVVYLAAQTMGSSSCQSESAGLERLYGDYKADGLMVIALELENADGDDPSEDDLAAWASEWGLHFPVLYDQSDITYRYSGASVSPPYHVLIDRGNVVYDVDDPGQSEVKLLLAGE